jgi:hypothetical protein
MDLICPKRLIFDFPIAQPGKMIKQKRPHSQKVRPFGESLMSFSGRQSSSACVSHENGHADDTDAGIFGLVSGNPGIDRIQRQMGSQDFSGALVHDGIHSSILSISYQI